MENAKDVESESGQLDCLDVPQVTGQVSLPAVVLREIFQNLSSSDLLNLSLVNKLWNYETQSVLRDRRSLTARMNTTDGRCKNLRAFASDLRRMREVRKVVPFSGLTIVLHGAEEKHGDWCNASSTDEMYQVYEDILHHMEWKHLALDLTCYWDREKNCAGFQLVKRILHHCSCILEEFSLNIESDQEASIQRFVQDCNFPRLKIMKFQDRLRDGDDVIKSLVARASNLEVLCTKGRVNLQANLLEGCSAVHVTDHPYNLPFAFEQLPESILGQLRLGKMCLDTYGLDFSLERLNMMVRISLEKSRTSLTSMRVEEGILVLMMQYGICLENVRALIVGLCNCHTSRPRLWRLMKSLDFTRVFPNLCSVEIYNHRHANVDHRMIAVMELVEQANAALIEPVNRTVNIKKLSLDWNIDFSDILTRFLVEMFPDIEKLVTKTPVLSVRCWDYWLDLEELDITLPFKSNTTENLDSALCGIFPEEVAELRQRDEEYLRSVVIVPVMPSLSSLKRLRTFTLFFDDAYAIRGDPSIMLSKLTGLIAFERRPELFVTLETNSDRLKRELRRMEPYASVRRIYRRSASSYADWL